MKRTFKRYCKTLELKNDAQLIEEYRKLHAMGGTWPEITQGMKDVGIIDMEIYITGTTLFMIMDTVADFDHDSAMSRLAKLPRQAEWEATVAKYQKTSAHASAKEKWRLIERIYEMDQEEEYIPRNGYVKKI
jgi:L-rhamnose mutarotase